MIVDREEPQNAIISMYESQQSARYVKENFGAHKAMHNPTFVEIGMVAARCKKCKSWSGEQASTGANTKCSDHMGATGTCTACM